MSKKNPHVGSLFSDWLTEQGLEEDAYNHAIKRVLALADRGRKCRPRASARWKWPAA